MKKNIIWFRNDLRISDNPALYNGCKKGEILPIYIIDDKLKGDYKLGGASKWWLYNSLKSLNDSLLGNLNIFKGDSREIINSIIEANNIDSIFFNRCYEPFQTDFDKNLESDLVKKNIDVSHFSASILWEPWDVCKADGSPYKVFTPFYKKGCLSKKDPRKPIGKPENINFLKKDKNSLEIDDLDLLPKNKWYQKMQDIWHIGEENAQKRLKYFIKNGLKDYKEGRNFPNKDNISKLSPYLRFGEISPNQIWYNILLESDNDEIKKDIEHFLSEIGWREFSYNLLYFFRDLPKKNFQKKFDNFSWEKNDKFLKAWQQGQTGFPIIDAGMRELYQTGYMHNRLRMVVGSFLVKNLLIDWRFGERWFWDCLVDADLANNSASWQWIAGSGADAAPYFRIFNPVLQGEKFDKDGLYTKKYVSELKNLPNKYLFKPWEAPQDILKDCGVELGKNYPKPIINISESRQKALSHFKRL